MMCRQPVVVVLLLAQLWLAGVVELHLAIVNKCNKHISRSESQYKLSTGKTLSANMTYSILTHHTMATTQVNLC